MAPKELDALVLNNTIVKMRKVVNQTRYRVSQKMIRQIKVLKIKKGTDVQKQANLRKIERLVVDLKEIKALKADEVSKCALVNTTTQKELETLMTSDEPKDRALNRLVGNRLIAETIGEFREKYPDWPTKLPFLLQRLGLQYKMKKKATKAKKIAEKLRKGEGIQSDEDTAVKEKHKATKDKTAISKPKFEEKKSGTTVIQKIDMTGNTDNKEDAIAKPTAESILAKPAPVKPSSSFFVGGESDSDNPDPDPDVKPDLPSFTAKFQSQFSASLKKRDRPARNIGAKSPKPKAFSARKTANDRAVKIETPSSERKPVKVYSFAEKKEVLDESKMHPSWIAKRKMKESLKIDKSVKNKKIKFD